MNIVVLDADSIGHDISLDSWKAYGDVTLYGLTKYEEIPERIKDADIVMTNKCHLDEKALKDAKNVKFIAELATGYNNIDIEYCKAHGIAVANVGGYSTMTVVQHTFALLLSMNEKLSYYSDYINSGAYSESPLFTNVSQGFAELFGKTYGIVGLGTIGKKVAEIATALGCKVIYFSASGHKQEDVPYEYVSFDELLERSDFISIHAPLNEKTKDLFDDAAFSKMKKSAILINVGRGPIVNEEAVASALKNDEILGYGADVFTTEPIPKGSPIAELAKSGFSKDRLLLTPHTAWASMDARNRLVSEVEKNLKAFFAGEERNRIV